MLFTAALISCSTIEEPEEPQKPEVPEQPVTPEPEVPQEVPITFSGHEEEERVVTRAGVPLSESATTFTTWGCKNMRYDAVGDSYGDKQTVFDGYTVKWQSGSAATTTTNSSGWEYVLLENPEQSIKYWDWNAAAYRFFAVTGEAANYSAFGTSGKYGPGNEYDTRRFTFGADSTDMAATPFFSHLWFSTGQLPTYADKQFGKPVQLEFLKPYARVRIMFNYSYVPEGVRLSNICFKPTADYAVVPPAVPTGIPTSATSFSVIYPLEGTENSEWFSVAGVSRTFRAMIEEFITGSNEKWYIVLANNTQGSYTLSVDINNTTKTAVVPAEYMTWLPGYSYTYIFKILDMGGVEIELVESAVISWTELEINHSVYNW